MVDLSSRLSSMDDSQLRSWRETGNYPESTSDVSPASSPVPAVEAAPATAGDQSASATDAAIESGKPKGKGVAARNVELDAEISGLRQRLEERAKLRQQLEEPAAKETPKPASSTAPSAFPKFGQWSEDPANSGKDFDDYLEARDSFVLTRVEQDYQRRESDRAAKQSFEDVSRKYLEKVTTFKSDHADFDEKYALVTAAPHGPASEAIAMTVLHTQNPALVYHLGSHLDEYARLSALPVPVALFELGQMAASLTAGTAPAVKTPAPVPQAFTQPPAPVIVGQKATTAAADDAQAALANGDIAGYMRIMNERESRA